MSHLLAIDAGTQSIRAIIFDLQGNICHQNQVKIDPYFSEKPGWAEQNSDYYWEQLCLCTRKAMLEAGKLAQQLAGMSLSCQRSTVVNLDAEGQPLRPAMVWLDQRRAYLEDFPSWPLKMVMKGIGLWDMVEHAITSCEANWIRQQQPEIWEQTATYLFLSGYFHYRLTGKKVDSIGNMVGYIPFDYKKQEWAASGDLKWKMFPIEAGKLPDLVPQTELVGTITPEAARQSGLPEGLPVIAGAADKACEVLGCGVTAPGTACLSYGTTATVETTQTRYREVIRNFPAYPSAVPGAYNTEVMIYRGYWLVSWFKEEFGLREVQKAEERGIPPEGLFDEIVKDIPPGSMGLTLQPYWSPGVKFPGQEAKGAIIGFGDVHTRAHIYRSILEGLAYALRDGLERTERATGVQTDLLRVAGGGSQSDVAMQVTADVFNRPAERPHTHEASALGAAILAAVGLGLYDSIDSAVTAMTRPGKRFEPDPQNVALYQELYRKVYRKMYGRLQGLYQDIRRITGYPV